MTWQWIHTVINEARRFCWLLFHLNGLDCGGDAEAIVRGVIVECVEELFAVVQGNFTKLSGAVINEDHIPLLHLEQTHFSGKFLIKLSSNFRHTNPNRNVSHYKFRSGFKTSSYPGISEILNHEYAGRVLFEFVSVHVASSRAKLIHKTAEL